MKKFRIHKVIMNQHEFGEQLENSMLFLEVSPIQIMNYLHRQ